MDDDENTETADIDFACIAIRESTAPGWESVSAKSFLCDFYVH